jgi:hypothetical protein
MCKICEILSGKVALLENDKSALNNNDLTFFKHAPATFCNVEGSFSSHETIAGDNRRLFTFESLKEHVLTQCNTIDDGN